MVKVFIKKGCEKTGLGRYAEGITLVDNTEIFVSANFAEIAGANCSEDIGVFAGYIPEEIVHMLSRFKRTYYVFTSPLGQANLSGPDFFSPELRILYTVLELRTNNRLTNVICTSKDLAQIIGGICLPPVLNLPSLAFSEEREGFSFIGNNLRKHKNVATVLAGISQTNPKQKVYVSQPGLYTFYEDLFKIQFASCSFAEDQAMQEAMSKHKLAFQCSYSESFNYIALEYAFHGIPCICSPCINWYPFLECKVNNIDSPLAIAGAAEYVLGNGRYWSLSKRLQEFAINFNIFNLRTMRERVDKL